MSHRYRLSAFSCSTSRSSSLSSSSLASLSRSSFGAFLSASRRCLTARLASPSPAGASALTFPPTYSLTSGTSLLVGPVASPRS